MANKSRFAKMLDGLEPAVVREVERHMYAAGSKIAVAAQISLTTGAVSGKSHVASAPGEAPNNDTGHLANNIEVLQVARLRVTVTSHAEYSAALEYGSEREAGKTARPGRKKLGPVQVEYGGSRTEARPFMGPAANTTKPEVTRILRQAAKRAIRAHFRRQ